MTLTDEALRYAAEAHSGQTRKGHETPYVVHPVAVGRELERYGADDALVAAGFLHDTVEDTDTTLDDIEDAFGPEVADLVDGASEHDKSAPWEERKEHTHTYLREEAAYDTVLVSCADKLDNIRSMRKEYETIGKDLWDRFERGAEDQQWYYEGIVDAIGQRDLDATGQQLYGQVQEEVEQLFTDMS